MAVTGSEEKRDMVSHPLFGTQGAVQDGEVDWGNVKGLLTGEAAFGDIFGMASPSQITYGGFNTSLGGLSIEALNQMGMAAQDREISPEVFNLLMLAAEGQTPSAAQLQMLQGLERSRAGMQSMAASNPNISPALAQRMAINAGQQMGLDVNQQMGILRAQEMAQAREAAGQFSLQQAGLNDALTQFYMGQGFSRAEAELKARQAAAEQQLAVDKANMEAQNQGKGGIIGAIGSIFSGLAG